MLKSIDKKALKEFQEAINNIIYDFSDCSICCICCKDQALDIEVPDAFRIARNRKMDKKTFLDRYTYFNTETKKISMNMPCPFLDNNRCKIYQIRPKTCRNFPVYVHDNGIVSVHNIEACAKATHFIELFKDFLEQYFPKEYKIFMNNQFAGLKEEIAPEEKVKNAFIDIKHIFYFIEWLYTSKVRQH